MSGRKQADAHANGESSRRVARALPNVRDSLSAQKRERRADLPSRALVGREARRSRRWLCRCRVGLVGEVEVGEVGLCPVGGELDGGLERLVEHERVAVKGGEAG